MGGSGRIDYTRYQKYFLDILSVYKKRNDLQMFLEVILSLVAVGLFGIFAIRPTAITIAQLVTKIQEKENTLLLMNQKIKNLQTAQGTMQKEAVKIALLKVAIPDEPKPQEYVRQIQGLGQKNQVSVDQISSAKTTLKGVAPKTKDGKSIIDMSILVSGPYPSLLLFLADVENLRRPIDMSSLSMSKITIQDNTQTVLNITGEVPFAPPISTPAAELTTK